MHLRTPPALSDLFVQSDLLLICTRYLTDDCPLYLQWIKTETDASSSSGNPSPEWTAFSWPLMHLVVLCFQVVSQLDSHKNSRLICRIVVTYSISECSLHTNDTKCPGKKKKKQEMEHPTGTSCIQHWNDTGELPHLGKHSRLFFWFFFFLFALRARICPISPLPEASSCSGRNRNIFPPALAWSHVHIWGAPSHTFHKCFGDVCKLILSAGSVCLQIRGQSSEGSTIIWLTAASARKKMNLCKVKAIFSSFCSCSSSSHRIRLYFRFLSIVFGLDSKSNRNVVDGQVLFVYLDFCI